MTESGLRTFAFVNPLVCMPVGIQALKAGSRKAPTNQLLSSPHPFMLFFTTFLSSPVLSTRMRQGSGEINLLLESNKNWVN